MAVPMLRLNKTLDNINDYSHLPFIPVMDLENLEVSLLVLPDFSPPDSPTEELFTHESEDWAEPGHGMERSLQLHLVDGHKQNRVIARSFLHNHSILQGVIRRHSAPL